MSGISSGVGLISGLNIARLIDQLIAIERRPIANLEARVQELTIQRTAFGELTAQLLVIQNAIAGFRNASAFRRFSAASTNDQVLTAEAGEGAVIGQHTFQVHSLVSSHSVISRGFGDIDFTPLGAGFLTVEIGHGRVAPATPLDQLNGGAGVHRGAIVVTDGSGASARIDLSTAMTVEDVLAAINSDPRIRVRASVTGLASSGGSGDRIVIEDLSGGGGSLTVAEDGSGRMAADLGIVGTVAGPRLEGRDLISLTAATPLSILNDGNGVGRLNLGPDLVFHTSSGDFNVTLTNTLASQPDTDLRLLNAGSGVRLGVIRITDRTGRSAEIDLSGARTVGDVLDGINSAGLGVSASIVNSFLQIVDSTNATGETAHALTVEDLTGLTAADLGLAQSVEGTSIQGRMVYRIATLGDVINAINYAPGNDSLVRASISADAKGLTLEALAAGGTVMVEAGASSTASDLGLLGASFDAATPFTSRRLLAGLGTVLLRSLNGGRGMETGVVCFVDRTGRETTIDFAGSQTLQDVIDRINAAGGGSFLAAVNPTGNGLLVRDQTGGSAGPMVIDDVSGSLAATLGIAIGSDPANPFDGTEVNGGNAQLQYVARQTLLSDLNGGRGIAPGELRITDSRGVVYDVLLDSNVRTVADVIDRIAAATPDTIEVRINDQGDGLLIVDTASGSLPLTIEDQGGRTAADLRLAGTARPGQNYIDGSYEIRIQIDAHDALQDLVRKLNEADAGVAAAIVNHGSSLNPFSLTISSEVSGRRGELLIDARGVDLDLSTLTEAHDAIITLGGEDAGQRIVVSSPSNTIRDAIPGVTLNLLSSSEQPVTITIDRDAEAIMASIEAFVEKYNQALEAIDAQTEFNQDTLERGPLLGDSTVHQIRGRLTRAVLRPFSGGGLTRLFSVGLRLGEGNRLQFDREKFSEVLARSPQEVERLFTEEETGVAAVLTEAMEQMTRDFDGLLAHKDDLLEDQQDILNKRIDALNVLLEAKRARLEAQFVGLEATLAALQDQQNALSGLAQWIN